MVWWPPIKLQGYAFIGWTEDFLMVVACRLGLPLAIHAHGSQSLHSFTVADPGARRVDATRRNLDYPDP